MSDLSRVLGDLYGPDDQPSVAPPRNFRAEAPEWADEQRLDEAFADWTPGPPPEAPAMEREMAVVIDTPPVPAARLDEDLAGALNAALIEAGDPQPGPDFPAAAAPSYAIPAYGEDPALASFPAPTTAPVPVAEDWVEAYPSAEPVTEAVPFPSAPPMPQRPWARADDDILPGRGPAPKQPRQPKAKGPKAPKAPKQPKAPKAPKIKAVKADAAEAPTEPKASRFKLELKRSPKAEKAPKQPKQPKAKKAPKAEAGERQPVKVFGITVRK